MARCTFERRARENLEIELCYEVERLKRVPRPVEEFEHEDLRRHIEALGGKLLVRAEAERLLRITARFGAASPGRHARLHPCPRPERAVQLGTASVGGRPRVTGML